MKDKKIIKHRILDHNYGFGIVLLTVLAFILMQIFGGVIGSIFGFLTVFVDYTKVISMNTLMTIITVVAAFLMLALHKRWFYPEFEGNLKTSNNLGRWLLLTLGILLLIIVPDAIAMVINGKPFAAPTLTSICTSLVAGTSEEVAFRGVPGSYGMRQINEGKKIPVVVLITSVLFSLMHATNLFAGASSSATLVQLVTTLGMGALFCAIYLRSGTIITAMMLHFIYDVYALMNAEAVSETGIMVNGVTKTDVIANLVLFVLEMLVVCFLLRKSVWDEVMALWSKKWNKQ